MIILRWLLFCCCGRWFDLNRLNEGRSRTAAHLVVLDTATGSCDSLSAVNNGPSLGPLLLSHPLTPSASPGRPSGYSNDRNLSVRIIGLVILKILEKTSVQTNTYCIGRILRWIMIGISAIGSMSLRHVSHRLKIQRNFVMCLHIF